MILFNTSTPTPEFINKQVLIFTIIIITTTVTATFTTFKLIFIY